MPKAKAKAKAAKKPVAEVVDDSNRDDELPQRRRPRPRPRLISGRAMKSSALTLTIVDNQGTGDVEYGKVYDVYFPPS